MEGLLFTVSRDDRPQLEILFVFVISTYSW